MALKYIIKKMTEFLNLQVYGVPIATYGLVGLTTAILAYATSISEMGENVSKSLTDITESPMASLSSMNPLAPSSEKQAEEPASALFASTEKEETSGLEENENSASPFAGLKGGKRRRNKTPKSKKSKNKEGKTKKNKSKSKK